MNKDRDWNQILSKHLTQQSTTRTKDLFNCNSVIWLFISALEPTAPSSQGCLFYTGESTLLFIYRNCAQASVNMNETSHVCTHHVLYSVSQPSIKSIKRINCSILGTSVWSSFSIRSRVCAPSFVVLELRQCLHPRSLAVLVTGRALRVFDCPGRSFFFFFFFCGVFKRSTARAGKN